MTLTTAPLARVAGVDDGEPSPDDEALDAYSRAVVAVAERLVPSVAGLRVRAGPRRPGVGGAGSAVVLSGDGLLLTSAHVVAGPTEARPCSPRATRPPSR